MRRFELAEEVVAATVDEWGPRLVAIPAGYAMGAWAGTLIAFLMGADTERRAELRDFIGAVGGGGGVLVWVIFSFVVD